MAPTRSSGGGDEETLASLAPVPPPPEPVAQPVPAAERAQRRRAGGAAAGGDEDEASLASLAPANVRQDGTRPRFDRVKRLLQDCIIGYTEGEEDPQQSGSAPYKQSAEIEKREKEMALDPPPVTKKERGRYVWVAKTEAVDGKDMFTMDPDKMKPVRNYAKKDQNSCDICGQFATETLFEFRCYRRQPAEQRQPGEVRALSPFISYIGKTCGSGLLGVRSEASKFREMVFRFVQGLDGAAPEALQAFWQGASAVVRGMLLSELGIMAGVESGDRRATIQKELQDLEENTQWGALHRVAEDPFRALSRALNPALGARDLAAVTVLAAEERKVEIKDGSYLAEVRASLTERRPLPPPPSPWPAADVMDALRALVEAWPMKITLYSTMNGTQELVSETTLKMETAAAEPPQKQEKTTPKAKGRSKKGAAQVVADKEPPPPTPTPQLRLAYASGYQALHGPQVQRLETSQQQRLKDACAEMLQRSRAAFGVGSGSGGGGGAGKGPTSKEDLAIEVPEKVEMEHVRQALEGITWPQCSSRQNVRPAGQATIDAFMLGLIKPYFQGLMCSRRTRMLPNLTRLCAKLASSVENINFTSIQLNKDYNARLHVDKNNHGPSWIIGLGDYEGGELWVLDEQGGNHELEVDEHMHGYRHLFGKKVKGKLVDIKNKWCQFDGNLPHKAMDFRGTRISIVYFTRKGWMEMEPATLRTLKELGFPIPDENFASTAIDQTEGDSLVKRPRFAEGVPRAEDSEDEVDENEEMHFEGSPEPRLFGWAAHLREALGVPWEQAKPHLGVVACLAGLGPGSALALQELLPVDNTRVLCVAEDKADGDHEGRLAINRIKVARHGVKAECAFSTLEDFAKGSGFCEIKHQGGTDMPAKELEQLFVAGFLAAPVSAASFAQRGSDDKWARPLRALRRHLEDRRPPIALFDIEDWGEVHAKHQQRVVDIVLDGKGAPGAFPGLRTVPGYDAELLEVRLQDCGLPVAGGRAFVLLLREDMGGRQELEAAAALARLLLSRLPRCTVQDVLLEDDDAALAEARKEWERSGKPGAPIGRQKAYTEHLRQEVSNEFVDNAWFPRERSSRVALNIAFDEARKSGLDIKSLVVDLGQAATRRPWRDDGLLPASAGTRNYGPHYSFLRHRPLTGREELLCRGLPVSRLTHLKGFSDAELRRLAPLVTPPPAAGAALAALLAVAKLRPPVGRGLQLEEAALRPLLAQAPPPPPGSLAAERLARQGEAAAAEGANDGSQLSSRAVAYLNLINGFKNADEEAWTDDDKKAAAALAKAAKAAVDASAPDDLPAAFEASSDAPPAASVLASKPDEQRDWSKRRSKLAHWDIVTPLIPGEMAMRWVLEAAEQDSHKDAHRIIQAGCDYIQKVFAVQDENLVKKRRLEEVLNSTDLGAAEQILTPLLNELRELGLERNAAAVEAVAFEVIFLKRLEAKDKSVLITHCTGVELQTVVRSLKGVKGRRAWLQHVADSLRASGSTEEFQAGGGFEALAEFIDDFKRLLLGGWKQAPQCLKVLAEKVPGSVRGLHCKIHAAAGHFTELGVAEYEARVRKEVEQAMAKATCEALRQTLEHGCEVLKDFCRMGGVAGARLEATLKLVQAVQRLQDADAKASSEYEASAKWKEHLAELERYSDSRNTAHGLLHTAGNGWSELRGIEDTTINEARIRAKQLQQQALRREEKEQWERREAEAKATRQAREERREGLSYLLQDAVRKIRRTVADCSLIAHTGLSTDNFKEVRDLSAELVKARENFEKEGGVPSAEVDEALREARDLARVVCQRPARLGMSRRRLRDVGMGHLEGILEAGQVLDRLNEMQGANANLLLDGLGLPPETQRRLLNKVRAGEFAEELLRPVIPRGWRLEIYKPSGLEVLVDDKENLFYEWSTQVPPLQGLWKGRPASSVGSMPHGFRMRGFGYRPGEKDPPYIYRPEAAGAEDQQQVRCMLCKGCPDVGKEHFQGGEHADRLRFWQHLIEALSPVHEAVPRETAAMIAVRANGGLTQTPTPGTLTEVWKEELLERLEAVRAPTDVLGLFWQTLVAREWPPSDAPLGSSTDELAAVTEALDRIMEWAVRPEPTFRVAAPVPGKDFAIYPPPDATAKLNEETPQEEVELLKPHELLGEGIETKPNGYRCGYCEEDIAPGQLAKHLHPYFTAGKRHRKYMQICREAFEMIEADGWSLGHEGIIISNKAYFCTKCKKTEAWYQVSQHISTNTHRNSSRAAVPLTPAQELEERSAWSASLDEVLAKHLQGLKSAAEAATAAAAKAAAAAADAAAAAPAATSSGGPSTRVKRVAPGSTTKSTSPRQEPRPNPPEATDNEAEPDGVADGRPGEEAAEAAPRERELPPLPVPGKDFPWLPRGSDGLEEKDGKLFCSFCNYNEVRDKEAHLRKKDHANYAQHFYRALGDLRKDGWRLSREGISLKDRDYHCKACEKQAYWWSLFDDPPHFKTKNHLKYRRHLPGEAPPDEAPADDAESKAWEEMFAKLEADNKALGPQGQALEEQPKEQPKEQCEAPQEKRLRMVPPRQAPAPQQTARTPQQPAGPPPAAAMQASRGPEQPSAPPPAKKPRVAEPRTAEAASSSGPPPGAGGSVKARPPKSAEGYGQAPDEGNITAAKKRAGDVWCPELPHPALIWGYFRKPQLWVWCRACEAWVAVVEFNYNTQIGKTEDGECPHYDAAASRKFNAAMQQVLHKKW